MKNIIATVKFYLFLLSLVVISVLFGLIQPYMEAKTYNRLTGSNVTTWDAIWVKLVVVK